MAFMTKLRDDLRRRGYEGRNAMYNPHDAGHGKERANLLGLVAVALLSAISLATVAYDAAWGKTARHVQTHKLEMDGYIKQTHKVKPLEKSDQYIRSNKYPNLQINNTNRRLE
jgi:hypothetical protein